MPWEYALQERWVRYVTDLDRQSFVLEPFQGIHRTHEASNCMAACQGLSYDQSTGTAICA